MVGVAEGQCEEIGECGEEEYGEKGSEEGEEMRCVGICKSLRIVQIMADC